MAPTTQKNLIFETSTTTGTGNLTTALVDGYIQFGDSTNGFGTGATTNVFDYFIANQAANEWEIGTGHCSALGTLVRDTVVASSNANALVSFSAGTKFITNDIPAAQQMRAANALSELSASAPTVATNLGLVRVIKKQVFTSSGTYTPSTGMLYCDIECIGAGGGGAGIAGATSQSLNACGGGGGEYAIKTVTAATIGGSQTVTIGAGGAGGAAGNNNGTAGGDSSVGTICKGKGGSGATSRASTDLPGAGGTGGTGDFKAQGQSGGQDISFGNTTQGQSGTGGASGSGYGYGGAFIFSGTGATAGNNGTNYGGGGSGAGSTNSTATAKGGDGAQGVVIITEYCTQ